MGRSLLLIATVTLLAASCGKADHAGSAVIRTDSAGVTIITSSEPAHPQPGLWTVEDRPFISIGTADGAPMEELFRAWSAYRMKDGGVVVGNAGTRQLRVYDDHGRFVRSVGRYGGGPGEFQDITEIFDVHGDSIGVLDRAAHRISFYDEQLTFGRMVALPGIPGVRSVLSVGDEGTQLVTASNFANYTSANPPAEFDRLLLRVHGGGNRDTLGRFFDQMRPQRQSDPEKFFQPWGGLKMCGGQIVSWREDRYELRLYDENARLKTIARRHFTPVRITDVFFDEYRAARLREIFGSSEGNGPLPPAFADLHRKRSAAGTHPEFVPPISDVTCDVDGNFWVMDYPAFAVDKVSKWSVFSRDGVWQNDVTLPPDQRVLEIGRDFILLGSRYNAEVEQVRAYRLVKRD